MDERKRLFIWLCSALFAFSVFFALYITVLCREPRSFYQVQLLPFWNYSEIIANKKVLCEIVANIALFIPIVFFLTVLLRNITLNRENIVVLIFCFIYSSTLETLQYFLRLGMCEVDDIIHNSLGGILGIYVYNIHNKIWKKT